MSEAQRLLRPGGVLVRTVSYLFGLDARAVDLLSRDPVFLRTGCTISARLDLRRMLEARPRLVCPGALHRGSLPGFEGFSESALLDDSAIILDTVGSYGDVRCLPETDALGLRWAEIGMYLVKR